jgi:hypothetical protein
MGDLYDFETGRKIRKTRKKSSPLDYPLNALNKDKHKYKHLIVIARDFHGNEVRYITKNTNEITAYELAHTLLCSVVKELLDDADRNE